MDSRNIRRLGGDIRAQFKVLSAIDGETSQSARVKAVVGSLGMDVGARVELRSTRLAGRGCGADRGRSQIFAKKFPTVGPGFRISSRGFQKVLMCICE